MIEKCEGCPLANSDRPCLAQLTRHPRYCRPEYRSVVLTYKNPHPEAISVPESNRVAAKQSLSLIARMKGCESWEASSSCGCGANKCLAGKGRQGIVNHHDCFACLLAQDATIAAPHPLTGGSGC